MPEGGETPSLVERLKDAKRRQNENGAKYAQERSITYPEFAHVDRQIRAEIAAIEQEMDDALPEEAKTSGLASDLDLKTLFASRGEDETDVEVFNVVIRTEKGVAKLRLTREERDALVSLVPNDAEKEEGENGDTYKWFQRNGWGVQFSVAKHDYRGPNFGGGDGPS